MRALAFAVLVMASLILAGLVSATEPPVTESVESTEALESAEAPMPGDAVFQQDPGNPCLGENDPFCESEPSWGGNCETCLSLIYADGSVEIRGCVPVEEGQTGGTACDTVSRNGVNVSCQIAGTYCSWITVTG